jgi:hypothetical protein
MGLSKDEPIFSTTARNRDFDAVNFFSYRDIHQFHFMAFGTTPPALTFLNLSLRRGLVSSPSGHFT